MQAGNERQIWPFAPTVPGTGAWMDGHGRRQQVIWRGRRGRRPGAWNAMGKITTGPLLLFFSLRRLAAASRRSSTLAAVARDDGNEQNRAEP